MLQRGGNAVDAAVATAIALTVVEPTSNGIGADAFALVWDGKKLHGLNGSGRAPATHTLELFEKLGHTEYPNSGWLPVTVPGAPGAWRDLHDKFGKLPFETLFEPAIRYAEGRLSARARRRRGVGHGGAPLRRDQYRPGVRGRGSTTFTKDGTPPRAGEMWQLPDHARTLRLIAESHAEAFYTGELAGRIADFAAETNGYICAKTSPRTRAPGSIRSASPIAATKSGRSRRTGRGSPRSPPSISSKGSISARSRASPPRATTCRSRR